MNFSPALLPPLLFLFKNSSSKQFSPAKESSPHRQCTMQSPLTMFSKGRKKKRGNSQVQKSSIGRKPWTVDSLNQGYNTIKTKRSNWKSESLATACHCSINLLRWRGRRSPSWFAAKCLKWLINSEDETNGVFCWMSLMPVEF